MRLIEQHDEGHFSEGEPDLEPPEELAVGELDDETVLEEELDNEDVLEQDVDDELLTVTLEDLAHAEDDEEVEVDGVLSPVGDDDEADVADRGGGDEDERLEILEVDDLEDLEESLDLLLSQRFAALDGDGTRPGTTGPGQEADEHVQRPGIEAGAPWAPSPCGPDEFLCQGCFLVRLRSQVADERRMLCLDCTS